MLVFLFLYKITVFSSKGKFINSATSNFLSYIIGQETAKYYIITSIIFLQEKGTRPDALNRKSLLNCYLLAIFKGKNNFFLGLYCYEIQKVAPHPFIKFLGKSILTFQDFNELMEHCLLMLRFFN